MEFHLAGLYLTKPEKKPKGCKFCWILHVPDPKNHRRWVASGDAHTHAPWVHCSPVSLVRYLLTNML